MDVYPGCIRDYIEAYREMWEEEDTYGENSGGIYERGMSDL